MYVILYSTDGMENHILGATNLVLEIMVNATLYLGCQHRIIIFSVPGHMEIYFAVDVSGHREAQR